MKFVEKLRQKKACPEAVEWVGDQTLACVFAQDALDAHWTDTTDTRPQEAIMAALLAIEAPSEETWEAAWSAAWNAAWIAARSAEGAAASAAWGAAWSAARGAASAEGAASTARARQVEQIRSMVSAETIGGLL